MFQYYLLNAIIYVILFFMGAVVFSYLALVIELLPKKENITVRHTYCPYCGHEQIMKDVFPIFSRIIYRGKCRYCLEKLPKRQLYIELLGGILMVICGVFYGISAKTFLMFLIICDLVVISFIDMDTQEIPPQLNVILLTFGIFAIWIFDGVGLKERFLGLIVISLPMFVLLLLFNGFGGGDVKLMAAAGFLVGARGIVVAFFIGAILGALYAVYLLITKKKDRKGQFAFGPFLAVGIMISLFNNFGAQLVQKYIDLLKSFQSLS